MLSQAGGVYFQTYQLAYELAKRAERAYRFERGLTSSDFIQFEYWDGLTKSLLAGECLHLGLKRLETACVDQNRREYGSTKHVSLVLHDLLALIVPKETGNCLVELPEALFDMDYPSQYMRRIKSVGLTMPAVTGPDTSVNCTLTLLSRRILAQADAQGDYGRAAGRRHRRERFLTEVRLPA